ncbi:hypothetical protein HID58_056991 [Brassica napus]|uniref:C2H2-type domain-containing protein n=1 Tax=Brassica napus TaxID=3708 RepID=A0ABQ8AQR2_BRANA|nr:hypothetical protein HID58_056991 [Brassica napus]
MRCHPKRQWRGINPPPNHRGRLRGFIIKKLNQRSPSSVSLSEEEFRIYRSYLLMLSYATPSSSSERFECGGSKKVFVSHHALGGHRASHRNVKGCFAITNVTGDYDVVRLYEVMHMRCHFEKDGETMASGALDLNVLARTHDLLLRSSDTSGVH